MLKMATPSPDSTASSSLAASKIDRDVQINDHLTNPCDELASLRAARKQAELKLQFLRKRYEDELAQFNETRVEHIFKNSGARDYFESLKNRTKIKDDIIKDLRQDLEYKSKEVAELQDRCKEAEKQSQEYLKAWKDAQMARDRLELEKKSNQPSKERLSLINQTHNKSSTSSINDNQVPPPPPIDVPSIEEIFRTPSSYRESNIYTSLDSSIPPPPNVEVPLDEILKSGSNKKTYEPEKGQFLCHVYLNIDSGPSQEILSDIVDLVEAEQSRSPSKAFQGWLNLDDKSNALDKSVYHVTLLRGHRTLHYHQIKPLVSSIETSCRNLKSFNLCLDKLRLFYNYERKKQFLCIASGNDPSSVELGEFVSLKQMLRNVIDQFADKSTEEDETDDTVPHCSIMSREVQQVVDDLEGGLEEIEQLCNENLDEYPICLVKVDSINLKIGKEVYEFRF